MIQNGIDLCAEVAAARREAGFSQQALSDRLGVAREKIARLEAGTGSVALLVQVMSEIPMRLLGIAKGRTIVEQIANARAKRRWSEQRLADATGLDARTIKTVEAGAGTVSSLNVMLSKLAPRAARQPVARIYWDYDRARMTEADCRFTPSEFLTAVEAAFGPIELDPCWHRASKVSAERTIALPECGLSADWASEGLVFVNPPYGDLASWIAKSNNEWERGHVGKLLLLFPASRLDIREFFDRTAHMAPTLILRERLRFDRLEGKGYPAPFALALTCFGCTNTEVADFRTRYPALLIPALNGSSVCALVGLSA
jgi:transcriptional regulator with XRE-family HTH domain